jgi:hypothetical protein
MLEYAPVLYPETSRLETGTSAEHQALFRLSHRLVERRWAHGDNTRYFSLTHIAKGVTYRRREGEAIAFFQEMVSRAKFHSQFSFNAY